MITSRILTPYLLALSVWSIGYTSSKDFAKMQPDVSTPEGKMQYLKKFGFFIPGDRNSRDNVTEAIMEFQKSAGLPQTGERVGVDPLGVVDNETQNIMERPRCGFAVQKERADTISKWRYTDLTYRIDLYPAETEIARSLVDATIIDAFKMWSDMTPLTFTWTSGIADIAILFKAGDHGDPYPFDGPMGVLAHAFFPHSHASPVESLSGDSHFDDAEYWTIKTNSVHEFGHSLGLDHSGVRDAIMYPYYTGYVPNLQLHSDDISRIQDLYPRQTTTSLPDTTAEPPPNCTTQFHHYDSMKRNGRKRIQSISTLPGCRNWCANSELCWAFSYNDALKPNLRCFTHSYATHYSINRDFIIRKFTAENETYYELLPYTQQSGGSAIEEHLSREECQNRCTDNQYCIALLYRRTPQDSRAWWCKLYIVGVASNPKKFDHYVKYSEC